MTGTSTSSSPDRSALPTALSARGHKVTVRTCAVVTGTAVAAGFGLAMATLSPLQTPHRVAESYMEALFDGDRAATWALLCSPAVERKDFQTFAEKRPNSDERPAMPAKVDVAVGGVRVVPVVRGSADPFLMVTVTITSDEQNGQEWEGYTDEVPVVEEDGAFRVCPLYRPLW